MSEEITVGIDLGTTNTCVGYLWNGKIEVMENKEGDRLTPSVVYFLDHNETTVGKYARKICDMEHTGGVSEVKRLIGRQFYDSNIQKNLDNFSYRIKRFDGDLIKIVVNTKTGTITKTPQEICSLILEKIKKDIDTKFGREITKAVITVPAYFNVSQREATLEAAKLAGFDVLKLLNEPTAAALSYFYKNINENNRNCTSYALVYDLGGGTFDVAILKRSNNQIDIICVDGDSYLGGYDLDQLLINYVCKILKERYNYNPRDKYEDMRRVLNECEDAKKTLSSMEKSEINLIGFTSEPIFIKVTRKEFESQAEKLFQRTLTIVDRCLRTSKLDKNEIDDVILAGGSTRIPKIQQLISEYFNGKDLNHFVHPDECVAEGAALQAAMLSSHHQQKIDKFIINDVTSLSLGTETSWGLMRIIIPRNSKIPTSSSKSFVTTDDKQTSIAFNIYEGERSDVNKNYKLATLRIEGLTPAPPGQCSVILTLSVDQNGILTATAKEELSGKTKDLKIVYTRRERNDSEIQSIIVDAQENQQEDEIFKKMVEIKEYLIDYCIAIKFNLDDKNLTEQYRTIYDRCDEIRKVAELLKVGDEERIRQLTEEVENLCRQLIRNYDFKFMPKALFKRHSYFVF